VFFLPLALLEISQHCHLPAAQHPHRPHCTRQLFLPQPRHDDGLCERVQRRRPRPARTQLGILYLRRHRHGPKQPKDQHLPANGAPLLRNRLFWH
jgi:hypothetical protein